MGDAVGVGDEDDDTFTITGIALEFTAFPTESVTYIIKFHIPVTVAVEVTKL